MCRGQVMKVHARSASCDELCVAGMQEEVGETRLDKATRVRM